LKNLSFIRKEKKSTECAGHVFEISATRVNDWSPSVLQGSGGGFEN